MVEVFREVRRVLAAHGTVWLNLGDSYASQGGPLTYDFNSIMGGKPEVQDYQKTRKAPPGLKPKDLVGAPWRVAFALQADGWWLRSDIVWAKPNPMPESVTDRPTKSHEYVFMLAKGQWKSRVVPLAHLKGDSVELGGHFGSYNPDVWAHEMSVRLASAILDRPAFQQQFGLTPLDSEVWEKRRAYLSGETVASLPPEHRAAVYAASFEAGDVTAKDFLGELYGLGITLSERNALRIGDGFPVALPPGVNPYGDAAVTVNHTGEIRKFDFVHGSIVHETPSRCAYFFDQEAVREANAINPAWDYRSERYRRDNTQDERKTDGDFRRPRSELGGWTGFAASGPNGSGRNIRSVWEIATQPYPEAHFATFPEELARRCIAAGCPEQVCRVCGKARERIVETNNPSLHAADDNTLGWANTHSKTSNAQSSKSLHRNPGGVYSSAVVKGWTDCGHADYRPGIVLDPFIGSGTVAHVARKLHRRSIGIDLNESYLQLAAKRLQQQSLFAEMA